MGTLPRLERRKDGSGGDEEADEEERVGVEVAVGAREAVLGAVGARTQSDLIFSQNPGCSSGSGSAIDRTRVACVPVALKKWPGICLMTA